MWASLSCLQSCVHKPKRRPCDWFSLCTRSRSSRRICSPVGQESVRSSYQSRLERGRNQDLLKANSRASGEPEHDKNSVDLISASQISSKAWSQPISAFPQAWKRFFFLRPVVKSWHGHKAKRGLHIHKKKQNKWSVNSQSSGCGVVPTGVALPGCTITATHLSPAFTNRLITCAGDDSSSHLIPTG